MLISFLTLLFFGCLTGVTTVVFGFGGGFVTVPVVYGFLTVTAGRGADAMHVAVATSTAVMLVNSVTATVAQGRQGRLRREYVWPLVAFVAVGAVAGSFAATSIGGTALRVLFALYLLVTIADSVLRKGFLSVADRSGPRPLGRSTTTFGGVGIGVVASCLGVGGSVMTVPLLRRRGLPMADATAMANPLSVPVAVAGTLVYALAPHVPAHPGRLGYVDLLACAALWCGSLPTIAVARRVVGRVPDRVHSVAYVALLVLVLVVMAATGI
ncbi:sulfite exporter TauE/SafE family protein [Streptantibioticus cattleyicolor]|uniref:Probable membrane transporter protein n=1 Tax=Streptantibioticus cattleyicolor (strain ATCC 35852 / DSM 46488 / JCM 4925 / NBRC 14057 / NRRL 8057) TaxID=1003195 RepID=F8JMG2_STREN|nr:sulfite exporter TauE/SafE family protein [Streptantibioticus cattleyicolor]AEW99360.1 putative permease [Streptantibioticus cattleyicolor NRRL 8057 = DSM 46488]CCB71600.1 Predicted permease [Streptantibioticus cattleyicolor NRRL 8057 = DSM 46488]